MSHTPWPGVKTTPEPDEPQPRPYPELTDRELEVAFLLAEGKTNREIADTLGVSVKTIDTHRSHALKKLGCKNNVVLARLMIRDRLVTP